MVRYTIEVVHVALYSMATFIKMSCLLDLAMLSEKDTSNSVPYKYA